MLNRNLIGKKYSGFFTITEESIKFYSKATGQTDPIYFDRNRAVKCGYKGIVCPPTFLTVAFNCSVMEQDSLNQYVDDLKIKIENMLHAEQEFNYEQLVFGGDSLTIQTEIIDMYDKKNGLMQYCVFESRFFNQNNNQIATSKFTIVIR